MKKEILKEVERRHSKTTDLSKILKKAESELDILWSTEGLNSKNNLEAFYNIWKTHIGRVGHSNGINSWTAYFLGMTDAKPTGEFLPTRRAFARAGFPDIDTDFDYENRDRVYAYIIDKYGRDNVGNIGTHGLLKFKSCVTRVAKALDLANAFHKGKDTYITENAIKVTDILSSFPKKGLLKVNDEEGISHLVKTFSDAYQYCEDFRHYVDKYDKESFKEHIERIEGLFANFGCLSKDTPILTNKGWIRIDKLTSKHKIAYINKNEDVKYSDKFKSFKTGRKKLCRMRLSNGSFIDVTDDHLIFTNRGCVKFGKIREDIKKYKIYGLKRGEFE